MMNDSGRRFTPPPPPYPPPAVGSDTTLLGFATNALKATQGQKLPVMPFMPAGQYVQAPPQQYNSVRYVHAPHAPTFRAPTLHYPTAPTYAAPIPTYAAPMALPAPQLQQYVPAPRVQFITQYVPAPPMPMQVHTVSAPPMPIQRELPRLSRTITLNDPENPYYNEYGVERYNLSETHNNIAANYEYMTKVKWDQPPQTSQNAQTNYSGGYSGEDSTRTVSLNDPENPYYSQYAAMRGAQGLSSYGGAVSEMSSGQVRQSGEWGRDTLV